MQNGSRNQPEWPMLLTLVSAVLAGIWIQSAVQNQMNTIQWAEGSIRIPAGWKIVALEPNDFAVADYRTAGAFGSQLSLKRLSKTVLLPGGGELYQAASNWTLERAKGNASYRLLNMSPVRVNGHNAMKLQSVYLQHVGPNMAPGLMHSTEFVLTVDDEFYIWSFSAEEDRFQQTAKLQKRLLNEWTLPLSKAGSK